LRVSAINHEGAKMNPGGHLGEDARANPYGHLGDDWGEGFQQTDGRHELQKAHLLSLFHKAA
jgi:hypothetical protein